MNFALRKKSILFKLMETGLNLEIMTNLMRMVRKSGQYKSESTEMKMNVTNY